MKTQRFDLRLPVQLLAWLMVFVGQPVFANELDDQGRLIAGPLESDLVERGYLFYPLRVLPRNQNDSNGAARVVRTADNSAEAVPVQTAPVSQSAPVPAAPLPKTAEPAVAPAVETPVPVAAVPKAAPEPAPDSASHSHASSQAQPPAGVRQAPASVAPQPAKAYRVPAGGVGAAGIL